mmetsp:Transcript_18410/g.59434  ORF Transcript_18410/g.59434 Transcript_18410/m.59434 type:complete len:764 (-) Transcript_18410:80-2371(-)
MGNAVPRHAAPAQQAYIDKPERHLIEDMRNTIVVGRIGNGRFTKSYHCKEDGVSVVVKVYVKQDVDEDLEQWRVGIAKVAEALRHCPNLSPYRRAFAGKKPAGRGVTGAAYCVRQHFWSNLYDRLGTRPFLSFVEKQWVAYQLLRAVEQCHARGVGHGDLTCENVAVTSWTWLLLVDFASFKPTILKDDGPEFDYYFCGSRGSRCYVAPERFLSDQDRAAAAAPAAAAVAPDNSASEFSSAKVNSPSSSGAAAAAPSSELTAAMDVFSLGCVLAEVFRNGTPTFDLATVVRTLKTKDAEFEAPTLEKKCPRGLCDAIAAMLARDPAKRGSAVDHRRKLEADGVLPREFSSFVYDFFVKVLLEAKTPDDRVALVCAEYGSIMREMAGVDDPDGAAFFKRRTKVGDDDQNLLEDDECDVENAASKGQPPAAAKKKKEVPSSATPPRGRIAHLFAAFAERASGLSSSNDEDDDDSYFDDDDDGRGIKKKELVALLYSRRRAKRKARACLQQEEHQGAFDRRLRRVVHGGPRGAHGGLAQSVRGRRGGDGRGNEEGRRPQATKADVGVGVVEESEEGPFFLAKQEEAERRVFSLGGATRVRDDAPRAMAQDQALGPGAPVEVRGLPRRRGQASAPRAAHRLPPRRRDGRRPRPGRTSAGVRRRPRRVLRGLGRRPLPQVRLPVAESHVRRHGRVRRRRLRRVPRDLRRGRRALPRQEQDSSRDESFRRSHRRRRRRHFYGQQRRHRHHHHHSGGGSDQSVVGRRRRR